MRLKGFGLIITAALCVALAVPSLVTAAKVDLKAKLKGANEVGGGDPNGTGSAEVTTNRKKKKVCSTITYGKIREPTAAHIHLGKKGENGPIVVLLQPGAFESGDRRCERNVDRDVIREIEDKPRQFYVNVHNDPYPDGAIRGQLKLRGD